MAFSGATRQTGDIRHELYTPLALAACQFLLYVCASVADAVRQLAVCVCVCEVFFVYIFRVFAYRLALRCGIPAERCARMESVLVICVHSHMFAMSSRRAG